MLQISVIVVAFLATTSLGQLTGSAPNCTKVACTGVETCATFAPDCIRFINAVSSTAIEITAANISHLNFLSNMESFSGVLTIATPGPLLEVSLPALRFYEGELRIKTTPQLQRVSLPALEWFSGELSIVGAAFESIYVPRLAVAGTIYIQALAGLRSVSFPSLVLSTGEGITLKATGPSAALENVSLPLLQASASAAFAGMSPNGTLWLPSLEELTAGPYAMLTLQPPPGTVHAPKLHTVSYLLIIGPTASSPYVRVPNVTLPLLRAVTQFIQIAYVDMDCISLPALEDAGLGFIVTLSELKELSAPRLVSVLHYGLVVQDVGSLQRLWLPALEVSSALHLMDCPSLEEVDMPSLRVMPELFPITGPFFQIASLPKLRNISLPRLEYIASGTYMADVPLLDSLHLPLLNSTGYLVLVGLNVRDVSLPSLVDAGMMLLKDLPALRTATAGPVTVDLLLVKNVPSLERLEFPALTHVEGLAVMNTGLSDRAAFAGFPLLETVDRFLGDPGSYLSYFTAAELPPLDNPNVCESTIVDFATRLGFDYEDEAEGLPRAYKPEALCLPDVYTVEPAFVPPQGGSVTVKGAHFWDEAGSVTVASLADGQLACVVSTWSRRSVVCALPGAARGGTLNVTRADGNVSLPFQLGACVADQYEPNGACVSCPAHSSTHGSTVAVERTECLCLPGYTRDTPDDNSFECATCPDGFYCPANSTAISCADRDRAGHGGGAAECGPCLDGYFGPGSGTGSCTVCPDGSACPASSTSPVVCSSLHRAGNGSHASTCGPCMEGYYGPSSGRDTCAGCPDGSACPASSILPVPCSSLHRTGNGSRAVTCGACVEGYYGATSGLDSCTECPSGSYCPAGCAAPVSCESLQRSGLGVASAACGPCLAGYQGDVQGTRSCQACLAGQYWSSPATCVPCPPYSASNRTGSTSVEDCVCLPGYLRKGNTTSSGTSWTCQPYSADLVTAVPPGSVSFTATVPPAFAASEGILGDLLHELAISLQISPTRVYIDPVQRADGEWLVHVVILPGPADEPDPTAAFTSLTSAVDGGSFPMLRDLSVRRAVAPPDDSLSLANLLRMEHYLPIIMLGLLAAVHTVAGVALWVRDSRAVVPFKEGASEGLMAASFPVRLASRLRLHHSLLACFRAPHASLLSPSLRLAALCSSYVVMMFVCGLWFFVSPAASARQALAAGVVASLVAGLYYHLACLGLPRVSHARTVRVTLAMLALQLVNIALSVALLFLAVRFHVRDKVLPSAPHDELLVGKYWVLAFFLALLFDALITQPLYLALRAAVPPPSKALSTPSRGDTAQTSDRDSPKGSASKYREGSDSPKQARDSETCVVVVTSNNLL